MDIFVCKYYPCNFNLTVDTILRLLNTDGYICMHSPTQHPPPVSSL